MEYGINSKIPKEWKDDHLVKLIYNLNNYI